MPDNKNRTGSPDSKRIDINTPHEVQYWCGKFDCSKEQLEEAVNEVGTSSAAVERYFRR